MSQETASQHRYRTPQLPSTVQQQQQRQRQRQQQKHPGAAAATEATATLQRPVHAVHTSTIPDFSMVSPQDREFMRFVTAQQVELEFRRRGVEGIMQSYRVDVLKEVCRGMSLLVGGNKTTLANRLAEAFAITTAVNRMRSKLPALHAFLPLAFSGFIPQMQTQGAMAATAAAPTSISPSEAVEMVSSRAAGTRRSSRDHVRKQEKVKAELKQLVIPRDTSAANGKGIESIQAKPLPTEAKEMMATAAVATSSENAQQNRKSNNGSSSSSSNGSSNRSEHSGKRFKGTGLDFLTKLAAQKGNVHPLQLIEQYSGVKFSNLGNNNNNNNNNSCKESTGKNSRKHSNRSSNSRNVSPKASHYHPCTPVAYSPVSPFSPYFGPVSNNRQAMNGHVPQQQQQQQIPPNMQNAYFPMMPKWYHPFFAAPTSTEYMQYPSPPYFNVNPTRASDNKGKSNNQNAKGKRKNDSKVGKNHIESAVLSPKVVPQSPLSYAQMVAHVNSIASAANARKTGRTDGAVPQISPTSQQKPLFPVVYAPHNTNRVNRIAEQQIASDQGWKTPKAMDEKMENLHHETPSSVSDTNTSPSPLSPEKCVPENFGAILDGIDIDKLAERSLAVGRADNQGQFLQQQQQQQQISKPNQQQRNNVPVDDDNAKDKFQHLEDLLDPIFFDIENASQLITPESYQQSQSRPQPSQYQKLPTASEKFDKSIRIGQKRDRNHCVSEPPRNERNKKPRRKEVVMQEERASRVSSHNGSMEMEGGIPFPSIAEDTANTSFADVNWEWDAHDTEEMENEIDDLLVDYHSEFRYEPPPSSRESYPMRKLHWPEDDNVIEEFDDMLSQIFEDFG